MDININQRSPKLSDLLVPALRSQLDLQQAPEPTTPAVAKIRPIIGGVPDKAAPPPLNVVIHVVGSRGDVQPFIALGKVLKEEYGHRIRLATHPTFRSFVEDNGLEFFSIGGDPAELMAFMVKNPGLMPGMDSLRSGDVGKRRKGMYEIVQGCWRSCIEIGDGTGVVASDDHLDSLPSSEQSTGRSINLNEAPSARPFVADAIIANPPSFAHIHCAEKLGIPLHLMFTYVLGQLLSLLQSCVIDIFKDALVANASLSAPTGQHSIFQRRPKHYKLHVLRSRRNDDMARLGGYHQPFPREEPWSRTSEPHVGPRHGQSTTHPLYVLLVSSICHVELYVLAVI